MKVYNLLVEKEIFSCPMHPEVKSDKPGKCRRCGMALVKTGLFPAVTEATGNSYRPLIIVLFLILIASFAVSYPNFAMRTIIESFMAGFFLIFSGFKLIDLKGFSQGYSTYDLLAMRWPAYGYIYPFLELVFGLVMILGIFEKQILFAEIIIMAFSGLGVLLKLLKREKFQCVCLGTFLKVPLTYVTLVEDFGMAALAISLLLIR